MSVPELLSAAQGYALILLLACAVWNDCRRQRIPNWATAAGVVAGLGLSAARGGWGTAFGGGAGGCPVCLLNSLTAAALLFAVFFVAYVLGGMGAGDVKLMTAVGALTGVHFSLWAALHIAIAGLPLALFFMVWRGDLKDGLRRAMRCSLRWRWRPDDPEPAPPPPATVAPAEVAAPAPEADATAPAVEAPLSANAPLPGATAPGPAPAAKPARHVMPYAIAVAVGVAWTVWAYWRGGVELPIF